MGRMGIVPVDNEPEETKELEETKEPEEETRCFRLTRIDAEPLTKQLELRIRR